MTSTWDVGEDAAAPLGQRAEPQGHLQLLLGGILQEDEEDLRQIAIALGGSKQQQEGERRLEVTPHLPACLTAGVPGEAGGERRDGTQAEVGTTCR